MTEKEKRKTSYINTSYIDQSWKTTCKWISKVNGNVHSVRCNFCQCDFSIASGGGTADIDRHSATSK